MTLKQLLNTLGYESYGDHYIKEVWCKNFSYTLGIIVNIFDWTIVNHYYYPNDFIMTSEDNLEEIKNELQQAHDQLQKDLKVLNKCQN